MPKFYVRTSFELPEQELFVLAGSIVEGEVRTGMFVLVPFSSSVTTTFRIHRVEYALHKEGEDVCLCIKLEPRFRHFYAT